MPLPDKVEAIKNIANPTMKKKLQSFIESINYYRDMWKHLYGILKVKNVTHLIQLKR